MKNWDDYRFILALNRFGSLRAAAENLGVNHSTLSRRLSLLNNKYTCNVFERNIGGYQISESGQALLSAAEQMEQLVTNAQRQYKATEQRISGSITLSIPDAIGQFLLVDVIAKFNALYPDINLIIKSTYQLVNLDQAEADIVIRGSNQPPEHLVGYKLFPYYLCLYANKTYIKNVKRESWQWVVAPNTNYHWIQQTAYANVPIGLVVEDVTLRHNMLLEGLAIGRAPCYMADPVSELVRLPNSKPEPQFDLWVLTHPDLRNTPRIKVLMSYICNALKVKRNLIEGKL
ncbi:MAG: DNA-binding transcriptional LysR family regulator [Alteromonadaceae bacterium]|jgi:DNA-binding transcriptional LysR family regulator